MRTIYLVAFAATALASAIPAAADTGATASTYVTELDHDGNQTFSGASPSATYGTTAYATISGGPTLTAHAADSAAVGSASAQADVLYHFTINFAGISGSSVVYGQPEALTVPLVITYAGSATVTGDGQAFADLTVRDMGGTAFEDGLNCSSDGGRCGAIGGSSTFDFLYFYYGGSTTPPEFNATGEIELNVVAQGHDFGRGFGADAMIDPTISFAPDFAAAHPDASISVEALAPVPEPGEWTMMAAGLGIVGTAVRRRRKSVA